MAADDVCVDLPTERLLAEYLPQVTELRSALSGRTGLVDCGKLKSLLDWRPRHHWQQMAQESERAGFPREAPAR